MNEIESSRLFCKPAFKTDQTELLFSIYYPSIEALVSLRSLDMNNDLDMIYDWVNQPYARRFWLMNGSRSHLTSTYQRILLNPHAHSFIGLINGKSCFQIDAYSVLHDELSDHKDAREHDTGLHLLMAPPKTLRKGWSLAALQVFQDYYFSFPMADRLFGEPDQDNAAANQLSVRAGFQFLKMLQMSYKIANLYCITRSHFQILRSTISAKK